MARQLRIAFLRPVLCWMLIISNMSVPTVEAAPRNSGSAKAVKARTRSKLAAPQQPGNQQGNQRGTAAGKHLIPVNPPKPVMTMPDMSEGQQSGNAPYFTLRDGMSSMLTLNNYATSARDVTVTLYNMEGRAQQLPVIVVAPQSIQQIQLEDVVASGLFDSGNVKIGFYGLPMEVTCQVSIYSLAQRISYESREQDPMDFMSTNLNGILYTPYPDAEDYMALTDTSPNPVKVKLTIGAKEREVLLSSRETDLVRLDEDLDARSPSATLIQLQDDGKPGDIITTGFVIDSRKGYSSSFPMVDSSMMTSKALSGAHVWFGKPDPRYGFPDGTAFLAPLLLANLGTKPVDVHVAVDYTIAGKTGTSQPVSAPTNGKNAPVQWTGTANDTFAEVAVKDLTVAPGRIEQVELSEEMARLGITGPTKDAGVNIAYGAAPGSVIGELTCVDQSGDYSFEVPVVDGQARNVTSGGSYPWTLENGMNTTLHLKNTTDKATFAAVQFRMPDGSTYGIGKIPLAPYQTVALDIQALKNSKIPNLAGKAFTTNATHGQVIWLEEIPHSLIGRSEEINVEEGISRSFSCWCPAPCCPSFLWPEGWGVDSAPGYDSGGNPLGSVGSNVTFSAEDYYGDCNGGFLDGPFVDESLFDFQSSDSSIFSVSYSSGEYYADLLADGQATIQMNIDEPWYSCDGYGDCNSGYNWGGWSATYTLTALTILTSLSGGEELWYLGGSAPPAGFSLGNTSGTVYADGVPSGLTLYWTVTSGSDKLQFSNSSSTMTTTSPSVGVNTIGYSTSSNDITVQLQDGTLTLSYNLQVDSPYELQSFGSITDTGVSDCITYPSGSVGWYSIIPYQIKSFFGQVMDHSYINEAFGTRTEVFTGNNWATGSPVGSESITGTFQDNICHTGASLTPPTQIPQSPLGSTGIFHFVQTLSVGSSTPGAGIPVQTDDLWEFQDHGRHMAIHSPVAGR